ncbi:Auxin-responsive protein IAA26 [Hibiscus syriacus]|uniref:Auxin-responsive protein n=1 Tax=Hibiscus syriacus TaxID=106335 RepID=A0A6A3BF21_HIBSY|nr:Auxin-responsive protein IAA26 [Hibiscus syriacus]
MESRCSKKLEEEKLELRLGPPDQEDNSWFIKDSIKNNHQERDESLLSFGYFPSMKSNANQTHKFPPPEDHRVGIAPGPVVGWPPVCSFRKNRATPSSLKPASEPTSGLPHKVAGEEKPAGTEPNVKGLFVKINMDGVPIGRKIDLKAYDSYKKLSTAVDELFRGLLAAQRDTSVRRVMNKQEKENLLLVFWTHVCLDREAAARVEELRTLGD